MFVTAFILWLVAVHGLELTAPIIVAGFIIDLVAWGAVSKMVTTIATGEYEPNTFDKL